MALKKDLRRLCEKLYPAEAAAAAGSVTPIDFDGDFSLIDLAANDGLYFKRTTDSRLFKVVNSGSLYHALPAELADDDSVIPRHYASYPGGVGMIKQGQRTVYVTPADSPSAFEPYEPCAGFRAETLRIHQPSSTGPS